MCPLFTPDVFSAQGSMGGHQQLPQHYASGCGGGVSSGSPSTNFANNLRALASLESQQNFQQTPLNVAQQFGFGGNGGHSGGYGNASRHSDQQQSGAAANSQYHHQQQQRSQQSGFNNTGLVQPYQSQNHRSNGYEQQHAMGEFRAGGGNQQQQRMPGQQQVWKLTQFFSVSFL